MFRFISVGIRSPPPRVLNPKEGMEPRDVARLVDRLANHRPPKTEAWRLAQQTLELQKSARKLPAKRIDGVFDRLQQRTEKVSTSKAKLQEAREQHMHEELLAVLKKQGWIGKRSSLGSKQTRSTEVRIRREC